VSSTSVTLAFARTSRTLGAHAAALALGTVAASTVMFARLTLVTAVLNPPLGAEVARLLAAPLAGGSLLTAVGLWRRPAARGSAADEPRNPLQIGTAIQMAALFQVVLMLVHWAQDRWGGAGLLASGAILGLTDTDALALSIAKSTEVAGSVRIGAAAIAAGGLSNTLVKLALALALGSSRFRLRAGVGLAALAVLAGIALLAVAPAR